MICQRVGIDELARGINVGGGMHACRSFCSFTTWYRPTFYSSISIFCSLRLSSVAVFISFLLFSLLILRYFTALSFVCLTFASLVYCLVEYCITPIFRVEEIFAIFANLDFARNFPPAKIISTANGISRNFPPAKFSSPRNFPPAKIKY